MREPSLERPDLGRALSFVYVRWGPVFAGALTAAALAFVLMTFAAALGLAIASPSPTWRDASVALAILSGVWMILVDVGSFGIGGYVAGRLRGRLTGAGEAEAEFRDGIHGVLVWALGVVIGALLLWASAMTFSSVRAGVSATQTTNSEPAFLAYELDRLFRSDRRPAAETDLAESRAEAGRVITRSVGRTGISAEDRAYLVRLVTARTGLPPGDADRRVTDVLGQSYQAASQARRSGVIIGFATAAALLAAAATAWAAALAGGRHRDGESVPTLSNWDWRRSFAAPPR